MNYKFSKITIFIAFILLMIGGFSVFHFLKAENGGNNILGANLSRSNPASSENPVSSNDFSFPNDPLVYVCPKATSLEEVYYGCPEMIVLRLGETKNGMTLTLTNYQGKEYYTILGFESGGAGVLEVKLETQIAITEMNYGEIDILDKITKEVGDKTSPLLLSELKEATIDLEDYTLEGKINPGDKRKLKMKFKFLETAGNEYQGKSIDVEFKFLATQEER